MSKLKDYREKSNLTQEELALKSGISVRTIQRIEAGSAPKGYTLKVLAKSLGVKENELQDIADQPDLLNYPLIKFINLSSIPVTLFPPLNIIFPLIIMTLKKEFSPMAKQLVSVQIMWTILAFILFMLSSFIKNWFLLGNKFTLIVMILLVLTNFAIILFNAMAIDKNKKLYIKLNFSLI